MAALSMYHSFRTFGAPLAVVPCCSLFVGHIWAATVAASRNANATPAEIRFNIDLPPGFDWLTQRYEVVRSSYPPLPRAQRGHNKGLAKEAVDASSAEHRSARGRGVPRAGGGGRAVHHWHSSDYRGEVAAADGP